MTDAKTELSRLLRMLWLALLVAQVLLLGSALLQIAQGTADQYPNEHMHLALSAATGAFLALGFLVRRTSFLWLIGAGAVATLVCNTWLSR